MNKYPYTKKLIEDGYSVSFNDIGMGPKLITVSDEGGQLIMFKRGRMNYDKFMDKLEMYAKDLIENGMCNDEVNGQNYKIW